LARSAGSVTLAGTASNFFFQCAGEAMKRLVKLMGRKLSGSVVLSSTVRSSILRADRSVGIRETVTPTWSGAKCGAFLLSTFSTFQTIASAFTGDPSWNLAPERSLKTHFVLSGSSTFHSAARPGISTLGLSAEERSQWVKAS
jgi:hypothetical protein